MEESVIVVIDLEVVYFTNGELTQKMSLDVFVLNAEGYKEEVCHLDGAMIWPFKLME